MKMNRYVSIANQAKNNELGDSMKYTLEPEVLTTLDMMQTYGFIHIMFILWIPTIIICILFALWYRKKKKELH